MNLVSLAQVPETKWKNGEGTSQELLRFEDNGELEFRISIAKVHKDSPFSHYPGLFRDLIILKGEGVDLLYENNIKTLIPLSEVFNFSGEEKIFCHLIDGPVLDFNVFSRKRCQTRILKLLKGERMESLSTNHYFYIVSGSVLVQEAEIAKDTLIEALGIELQILEDTQLIEIKR